MISPAYKALLTKTHADVPEWGSANGAKYVEGISKIITPGMSVIDYGCGKGSAGRALLEREPSLRVTYYDPGIPKWSAPPAGKFDLVVCLDVLEHIEPEHVDAVIAHLRALAKGPLYLCIFTRLARQMLADGRNAHLIVQPAEWWLAKLRAHGIEPHDVKFRAFKLFGEFRCA